MITKAYIMKWPLGLHARPSSKLTDRMRAFNLSEATLSFDGGVANLMSIMSLLTASLSKGKTFELILIGDDEKKAFDVLDSIFSSEEEVLYE